MKDLLRNLYAALLFWLGVLILYSEYAGAFDPDPVGWIETGFFDRSIVSP